METLTKDTWQKIKTKNRRKFDAVNSLFPQ
jgi:hypothetical protein